MELNDIVPFTYVFIWKMHSKGTCRHKSVANVILVSTLMVTNTLQVLVLDD